MQSELPATSCKKRITEFTIIGTDTFQFVSHLACAVGRIVDRFACADAPQQNASMDISTQTQNTIQMWGIGGKTTVSIAHFTGATSLTMVRLASCSVHLTADLPCLGTKKRISRSCRSMTTRNLEVSPYRTTERTDSRPRISALVLPPHWSDFGSTSSEARIGSSTWAVPEFPTDSSVHARWRPVLRPP